MLCQIDRAKHGRREAGTQRSTSRTIAVSKLILES